MDKNKMGFTLLELLIVITILSILAGAMIPLFRTNRREAQLAKVATDQQTIKKAAIMLRYDTGVWPDGWNNEGRGLINDQFEEDGGGYHSIPGWRGPYLNEWGNDPWGSPYMICFMGNTLHAKSIGPDRIDDAGGGDDIIIVITEDRTR